AAAGGFLRFALSPLWWTPHSLGHPDYGFHGPLTLVANCYLIAGLAFLAYMTWRARRDQPGGRRAHEAAAVRVGVQPRGAAVTCGKRQGRGVIHRFDAIPLSAAVASLPSVLEWRSGIRS